MCYLSYSLKVSPLYSFSTESVWIHNMKGNLPNYINTLFMLSWYLWVFSSQKISKHSQMTFIGSLSFQVKSYALQYVCNINENLVSSICFWGNYGCIRYHYRVCIVCIYVYIHTHTRATLRGTQDLGFVLRRNSGDITSL